MSGSFLSRGKSPLNLPSTVKSVQLSGQYRFDPNRLRQPGTDGQARIADQTDDVGLAGQEFDDLFLTKADFTQSARQFGGGAKLFDADSHAGSDTSERTQCTMSLVDPMGNRFVCRRHMGPSMAVNRAGH